MSTSVFSDRHFLQLLRLEKQFFHKIAIRILLMVLHHSQDIFQITEGIQIIRLRCFCDTVDDSPGFRTIDTVQLPCMFV